jgi:hypothetical protein
MKWLKKSKTLKIPLLNSAIFHRANCPGIQVDTIGKKKQQLVKRHLVQYRIFQNLRERCCLEQSQLAEGQQLMGCHLVKQQLLLYNVAISFYKVDKLWKTDVQLQTSTFPVKIHAIKSTSNFWKMKIENHFFSKTCFFKFRRSIE